ncbi:hypothetical protein [Actinomadura nitritigenes]|uniref:hypothetical protein n=1 Tax=Actinomadura nitritigenes TaxID=134602 RepID=UPI003D932F25
MADGDPHQLPAGLAAASLTAALAASPTAAHADTAWTVRKAPFTLGTSGLTAVAAAGPTAIWAGGYQWQSSYVPPFCGELGPCSPRFYQNPVLQSGDGASWSWIGTPGMTGSGQITALDAVSATDVWAAGPHDRSDGGNCGTPYLAHLSGGAWNEVSAPPLTCFFALDAEGAGAWAAGYADLAHGGSAVYRWSGAWTAQDTGAMDVRAIRQRTPGDVWTVGDGGAHHWDGSAWQSPPAPDGVWFTGPIADDGAGGVWAAGARRNSPEGSVLLHYADGAWRTEFETTAVVKGLTRVPGTRTLWAVGALAGKPYVISTG